MFYCYWNWNYYTERSNTDILSQTSGPSVDAVVLTISATAPFSISTFVIQRLQTFAKNFVTNAFINVFKIFIENVCQPTSMIRRVTLLCPRPVGGGSGALSGHRRPSSVRPSVCLSDVAYIGSNSKTKRPRKTKLCTGVPQVTCDSHTDFKVKRSKVKVIRGGAYCGGHLAAQLVLTVIGRRRRRGRRLKFTTGDWDIFSVLTVVDAKVVMSAFIYV